MAYFEYASVILRTIQKHLNVSNERLIVPLDNYSDLEWTDSIIRNIMSLSRHIICTYLFVILLQIISHAETVDLVNEYYTTTTCQNDGSSEKAPEEAQVIWNHEFNEDRMWIDARYSPINRDEPAQIPFTDLCFALSEDENVVLGRYLEKFFKKQERDWIIMAMVLTKDMLEMIKVYEAHTHPEAFKELRKKQKRRFEHLLRVWVKNNRDPIESNLDNEAITKDAETLISDYNDDCWEEKRDCLELITITKSIPYARAVFSKFEALNGKPIDFLITSCAQSNKLDADLGNAYHSLVRYIQDKYSYIAKIIHDNCNDSQWWAALIMSVSVVQPQEWAEVDKAFQKLYKSEAISLSGFIVKQISPFDKVMAEAIALIVDSNFKPTAFKKYQAKDGSG